MKKILLIDDEKDFTELTGTLLKFHDFDVTTLNDSIQIEKELAQHNFDLIVTDLMMPGLDGFKLIERVRAMPVYQGKPIFVLSAKTLSDAERKFLLQHHVNFFIKPFEPQGLVEEIRQALIR